MLKTAYFSSLATAVSTPLYLFAGELADLVVLGLLGATALFVVLGLARAP
jgi:hypothetical protein